MRGNLLLLLLLVTGVAAQTDKTPASEHAATAAKTKVKTGAVRGQKQEAQADTKKAQEQAKAAQAKTDAGKAEEPQAETDKDPKLTPVPGGQSLGMSILGNQEAPTSLVIVPWKSSEVGRATGISPMLDDSRRPVDKEVFMRELRYFEIRSEKKQ